MTHLCTEVCHKWGTVIRLLLVNRNVASDTNLQTAMKQVDGLLEEIQALGVSQDAWRMMIEQKVPKQLAAVCSMAYRSNAPRALHNMYVEAMIQLLDTAVNILPETAETQAPSSPIRAAADVYPQSFWQQLQEANIFSLLSVYAQSFWQQLQEANFFSLLSECMEHTAQQLQRELEATGTYAGLTDATTASSSSSSSSSSRSASAASTHSWASELGGGACSDTLLKIQHAQLLLHMQLALCETQEEYAKLLPEAQLAVCSSATASAAAELVLAAMQYACRAADPSAEGVVLNSPGPCAQPADLQPLVRAATCMLINLADCKAAYNRACNPVVLQSKSYLHCTMLALALALPANACGVQQSSCCSNGAASTAGSSAGTEKTAPRAGSSSSGSGTAAAAAAGSRNSTSSNSSSSSSLAFKPKGVATATYTPGNSADPSALAAAAFTLQQPRLEVPDALLVAYCRVCALLACDPAALWAVGSYAKHAVLRLQHYPTGLMEGWVDITCRVQHTMAGWDSAHFSAMSELQLLQQMQLYAWAPPLLLHWLRQHFSQPGQHAMDCRNALLGCEAALGIWSKLAAHHVGSRAGVCQYARGSGCDGLLPFEMLNDMLPLVTEAMGRLQKLGSTAAAAAAASPDTSGAGQPPEGAASSQLRQPPGAADCTQAGADLHRIKVRLLLLIRDLAAATMWDEINHHAGTAAPDAGHTAQHGVLSGSDSLSIGSSGGSSGGSKGAGSGGSSCLAANCAGLSAGAPDVSNSKDQHGSAEQASGSWKAACMQPFGWSWGSAPQWERHHSGICRMAEAFVRQTASHAPGPSSLSAADTVMGLLTRSDHQAGDQPGLLLLGAHQAGMGSQQQQHCLSLMCSMLKLCARCCHSDCPGSLATDAAQLLVVCSYLLRMLIEADTGAAAAREDVASTVDILPFLGLMGSWLLRSAQLQQQFTAVHASNSVLTVLAMLRNGPQRVEIEEAGSGSAELLAAADLLTGAMSLIEAAHALLSAHSAELTSAGYDVQAVLKAVAAVTEKYALLCERNKTDSAAAALDSLQQQLHTAGLALCSFAVPFFCNNPLCSKTSEDTELASVHCTHVKGCSKLCKRCQVARYCCRECQVVHWKLQGVDHKEQRVFRHSRVCKQLVAARNLQVAEKQ